MTDTRRTLFSPRRAALALACAGALAIPAQATWSIVVLDRSTGEICIAGATCLTVNELARVLAVVVPGVGVAAAQSAVDVSGDNRVAIWGGIQAGLTPAEILAELAASDGAHGTRQYGIVNAWGPPVSFTGNGAGRARHSIAGEVGDIAYAMQGNVLTAKKVIKEAEIAFLENQRDLGMRVMAAMEAARRFGGDGRCSCSQSMPNGCGSPPPDFEKSAHSAFFIISRVGDQVGTCFFPNGGGCANGDYYLNLKVAAAAQLDDPVTRIRRKFLVWRESMHGVPDQMTSRLEQAAARLVADGVTSTEVTVRLFDLHGDPLTRGGQSLEVLAESPGPPVALVGPIVDNGDGTHTFDVTATDVAGMGSWRVEVTDAGETIWLESRLVLVVDPLVDLHAGFASISAEQAPGVPFVLNLASEAGRSYNLIGSAAGTSPGITIGGQSVPLNRDRLFQFTYLATASPLFSGSAGVLDATGRAQASLELPPAAWEVLVGSEVHFVALIPSAATPVTNLVSFEVVP